MQTVADSAPHKLPCTDACVVRPAGVPLACHVRRGTWYSLTRRTLLCSVSRATQGYFTNRTLLGAISACVKRALCTWIALDLTWPVFSVISVALFSC